MVSSEKYNSKESVVAESSIVESIEVPVVNVNPAEDDNNVVNVEVGTPATVGFGIGYVKLGGRYGVGHLC